MSRVLAFAAVVVGIAALCSSASAQLPQPGQPPKTPLQFKPFGGVNAEQFQQSAVNRWIGQVILDAGEVKADAAASKLGFGQKTLINGKADSVIQAAGNLQRSATQGANRNQLMQALTLLD